MCKALAKTVGSVEAGFLLVNKATLYKSQNGVKEDLTSGRSFSRLRVKRELASDALQHDHASATTKVELIDRFKKLILDFNNVRLKNQMRWG